MNKRIFLLIVLFIPGCATNPAVIKAKKIGSTPFTTEIYLNGQNRAPAASFPAVTTGQFTDERDKQTYKWVKVGSQVWMAQNLNYQTETGSVAYNNDQYNAQIYGRLYTFSALLKACPKGWHVPTDTEWMLLERDLGLAYAEAGQVGSRGNIAGKFLVGGLSGFDALYAGRQHHNHFSGLAASAYFWTSTGYGLPIAYHEIRKDKTGVYRDVTDRDDYLSLRCVKDYW
ncbi:hypothetical protein BEL04_16540 [Mucilaginibacter sp. PPCGB 2223]|uniref:FISUMP domain-containing protein n=1 Tax=Mucilaginibacter sp. PPCGB 2223 TaxID=1886027 RepID=UPI0008264268|nr:FISUMP domain-containing protein [Mucilaginibacter sp. PPCGB 2223]OCX51628.1 hypothetical protein BEL04_16540 [Mucilaginibacter sp. PPCGB 2223]